MDREEPAVYVTQRCRTCGAPIVWAVSRNGKAMPLDAQPREDGNVVLVYTGPGSPLAVVGGEGDVRYTAHFVTCPDASGWRRKK